MAFFSKFSLAIVIAGLAVALVPAQTAKKQSKNFSLTPSSHGSCPVEMQAEHSPGLAEQVRVGKGSAGVERRHAIGQHLQLGLSNSRPTAIDAVRITVHGWMAKGRALPANPGAGPGRADASRTVDVKVNIAPHHTTETDVWVDGLTAVTSIDLVGVSYADGSNWKASAQECRIVPDLEMLISRK